jgi:hypothetical protein
VIAFFSIPASFGTADVATANVPNNNMNKGEAYFIIGDVVPTSFLNYDKNKGQWMQDKHKIFMQEYEKYMAIIACKLQDSSAHNPLLKLKSMLNFSLNKI